MKEEQSEIVVFRQYDNSIDANLAKTKLDAYGVPCFLTEENMANLYPGQPFIAFKVRLHLFAHDQERALQILSEGNLSIEDSAVRCPRCNSARIVRDFPKHLSESFVYVLFGILFPDKKVNHCLDCESEFDGINNG